MKLNRRSLRKMILKEMAEMSDYQPNTILIYPDRYTYEEAAPAYLEYLRSYSQDLNIDKARQAFFATLGLSPSKAFDIGIEGTMQGILRDPLLNNYMREHHGQEWRDYSYSIKKLKDDHGAAAVRRGY